MSWSSSAKRPVRAAVTAAASALLVLVTNGAAEAVASHYVYVDEYVSCPTGQSKWAYPTGNTFTYANWYSSSVKSSTLTVITYKVQLIANQTATFTRRCYDSYAPYTVRREWPGNVAVTYNPDGKHYPVN